MFLELGDDVPAEESAPARHSDALALPPGAHDLGTILPTAVKALG
jgi:hypothetical protein